MGDPNGQGVVKPEVVMLESLLDDLAAGRLRVPRFQRPFVWEPEQMLDLFDSIERGYPIGSILVWETTTAVPSLDVVGGIDIPPPPQDTSVAYLLDGHQRLSTLFGSLVKRPAPAYDGSDAQWQIFRRLGQTQHAGVRFQHWQDEGDPPATLLPLQAVLRTMDFLSYARRLARTVTDSDVADGLVDEAERLAQEIKSYKIALIRLVGGSLSHAVEAFARLNSGGRQITPLNMVSALTYRPDTVLSLSDQIDVIRSGIAAGGFGDLPAETVFQTIVALTDEFDVWDARWADFSREVENRLTDLLARAESAITRAVQFLRYEAGVPLVDVLPYPLQLVLLAAFFDRVPYPGQEQVRELVRWFWGTSWSNLLRSVRSFDTWAQLATMRDGVLVHELSGALAVGRPRPFPAVFDPDHPRVRAYLLWEIREFGQRLDLEGGTIDVVDLLAKSGMAIFRPVFGVGSGGHTADRIVLPAVAGSPVRQQLRDLPVRELQQLAGSHGIPAEALAHLLTGDAIAFVRSRAAFLAERERTFMADMGVEPSPVDADQEA
jgi:hypothetical protein